MKKIFILFMLYYFILVNLNSENFFAATAEWSPYAMEIDKKIIGISVEILQEIAKITKDNIDIKLYPAVRLNNMFDNNKIDINFADSPLWNDVTENSPFIFSEAYTNVIENIYFLEKNYIDVKKPEELKGKNIGIVRGYYYQLFEDLFNKNIVIKVETNNEQSLIDMLKSNRIDAAFFDNVLFDYLLKKNKYPATLFKKGMQLSDSPLCLKIRIERKNSVEKFNNAIRKLKKDGIIEKIIKKYIN